MNRYVDTRAVAAKISDLISSLLLRQYKAASRRARHHWQSMLASTCTGLWNSENDKIQRTNQALFTENSKAWVVVE
jgi:hypothetical protein